MCDYPPGPATSFVSRRCRYCDRPETPTVPPPPPPEVWRHTLGIDLGPFRRPIGIVTLDHHRTSPHLRVTMAEQHDRRPDQLLPGVVALVAALGTGAPVSIALVTNGAGRPVLDDWKDALIEHAEVHRYRIRGYPTEDVGPEAITREDLGDQIHQQAARGELTLPPAATDALRGWEGRPALDGQHANNIEPGDVLVLPTGAAVWHATRPLTTIHNPADIRRDQTAWPANTAIPGWQDLVRTAEADMFGHATGAISHWETPL